MLKSLSSDNRKVFDIVNIAAGLGLLLSPWYLGSKPNHPLEKWPTH